MYCLKEATLEVVASLLFRLALLLFNCTLMLMLFWQTNDRDVVAMKHILIVPSVVSSLGALGNLVAIQASKAVHPASEDEL